MVISPLYEHDKFEPRTKDGAWVARLRVNCAGPDVTVCGCKIKFRLVGVNVEVFRTDACRHLTKCAESGDATLRDHDGAWSGRENRCTS